MDNPRALPGGLSLGAMVSKPTIETIAEGLSDVGLKTSGTGAERSSEYRFNPAKNGSCQAKVAQQIPDEREVGTRPSFHHVSPTLDARPAWPQRMCRGSETASRPGPPPRMASAPSAARTCAVSWRRNSA